MTKRRISRKSDVLAYSAALEVVDSLDEAGRLIMYYIFIKASVKTKKQKEAKVTMAYFKQAIRRSRSKSNFQEAG